MRQKRKGGRSERLRQRTTPIHAAVSTPKRRIPTIELLDEGSLDRLEDHADWILQEVGIEFRGDTEALDLFRTAGAKK